MRVLFLATPQTSHVFPMIPLAWALRAAGHDVLVATSGPGLLAARSGLPVIDFGTGDDRTAAEMPRMIGEHANILWARLTRTEDGWPMLADATRSYTDQMVAVAESWQPDLIVHSQLQGGGPIAAAKLGVPSVEHGFGLLRTGEFYDHLPELVPEVLHRHGLDTTAPHRTYLDVAPQSVVTTQEGAWLMRFVPYNGDGLVPDWVRELPARPRIVVTLGTAGLAGDVDGFLRRVLHAAASVDAEFFFLGNAPGQSTVDVPDNCRMVSDWVPLGQLLAVSSAIVHHGGGGTMLTAFDAGVPQLSVPAAAPNYLQSLALRERGSGFWADLDEIDAAALDRLLTNEKMRVAAEEVRDEVRAMPAPADLVPALVALTDQGCSRTVR